MRKLCLTLAACLAVLSAVALPSRADGLLPGAGTYNALYMGTEGSFEAGIQPVRYVCTYVWRHWHNRRVCNWVPDRWHGYGHGQGYRHYRWEHGYGQRYGRRHYRWHGYSYSYGRRNYSY